MLNIHLNCKTKNCRLDDDIWDVRLHFQGRDNMERKYFLSDITFLNLVALVEEEIECFGSDSCLYFVREQGHGLEGLLVLDSDDAVEEMIEHCHGIALTVLNIIVKKGNDDISADLNKSAYLCEEQVPIGSPDGYVLSLSQDGIIQPVEAIPNTQQSCNVNRAIDWDLCGEEEAGEDEQDKSSSDFDIDVGEYSGKNISYKDWQRGQEKLVVGKTKPDFEGDSDPSEFWEEDKEDDSEEENVAQCRPEKLKPIRRATQNLGPTSRSHYEADIPKFVDFVPEDDEFCFPGDDGISHSDEDVPVLPSGRKRRLKKKKERKWYDPAAPGAHEQLCKDLCFTYVYEFRNALRDYHVRTLRNFEYHRNDPLRIIVWCPDRLLGCPFYMTASKVAHEQTFSIKKINLNHTCGASGESTKVTAKWVANAVEDTMRSNVKADVSTILKETKKKFGVHVPRSMAYRARQMAVDVVQGDHRTQYLRLRDYLQCVLDTNHGSRCIVTTFDDPLNPAPTPRFKYMFYCLQASKDGFLAGCRPFIGIFSSTC